MCPDRALAGLQAVLGFHRHQLASLDQLLELPGDLLLQSWAVGFQVADEQVHQGLGSRAYAVVGTRRARQLADQEDQRAQAGPLITIGRAIALLADDLVVFALQLAGIEQVGGDLVVDEVGRHHRAHGRRCGLARGLEDDLQLRAQLGLGAGVVGVAQHLFPEPPAGGQQWVVGDKELVVFLVGGQASALQVAGQLALIGRHALGDGRLLLRLFAQDRFADDAFDIGV